MTDLMILYVSKEHFKSLIAVLGIWMYASFNYYLIGYYVKYFPGDVFVNFLMMTIAEVISPLVLFFIQRKIITKYASRYLLLGAAVCAFIYIINEHLGS